MKLIIGLGNPEEKYSGTRHNVGFWVLDRYAKDANVSFQTKDKFKADLAELSVDGEKVILAKPTTYYNLSGEAVQAIANFYKVEAGDILIVHDELALPMGTVRTRIGGSDAGNNGVKSITEHVGSDTARLRVGISNDQRDQLDDAEFVLNRLSKDEAVQLRQALPLIIQRIESFIGDTFEPTTHR